MEKNTLIAIISKSLNKAIDYKEYRQQVQEYVVNKSSSGPDQSEAFINYTKLGDARMRRLDKTIKIDEAIEEVVQSVTDKITWLVITESWCGDAGHALPVINRLASLSEHITLKIVYRDENTELMDRFLTNGGRSIPKLIQLDENMEVTATWGPRPSTATNLVNAFKEANGGLTPEFKESLQLWYNKDKGQTIARDLAAMLS